MPQAIPAAATAFASWVSGAVYAGATALGISAATASTVSIFAAYYAYAAVGYGAQALVAAGLGAMAQAQVPDVETGKITRKQTRPLRTFMVGGTSRVSGAYMLRETKGSKFGGVIACCEGRLASVSQVYLNDDKVTLSGGYVQGMANERYGTGDLVRLEYRLGLPTETHYGFLTADFGTQWPTTSRGDGIASIGWLAQHRSTESFPRHFPNGEIIPSMASTPVCYDWRDGTQTREDPSTWKACWNPVVWLVHVEWHRHGRSWTRCIAPVLTDLTAEADYCDVLVEGEARYRCAGNYPSNLTPDAVRGNLLATMDGWMSVNGKGQLVVKAGRYVAPTFTLTGEHIVGYSWRSFQVAEEAVTDLVVSYVSAAHDYSEVEAGTYSKAEPSPVGKSETLQLPWCPSAKQGMRLARRKMTRLDAERRGSVRSTIYGLNGLGQRYIRVQNPELASMADVVLEVMNVELDLARGQVVFEVILADTTIDADETVTPDVPGTPVRPPPERGYEDPADRPIGRDIPFPIEGVVEQVNVAAFNAQRSDGTTVAIPATSVPGLAASTTYGVFWREDAGVEVEAYPADNHMLSGSWLFLGWQATPDVDGVFPLDPAIPGGWGGDGTVKDTLAAEVEGRVTSALGASGTQLALYNSVSETVEQVLEASDGDVFIRGLLTVGLLGQIKIDPSYPAITWKAGAASIAIGKLPDDGMLFWFGPTQTIANMTKANARVWMDTTGAAYFGGTFTLGTFEGEAYSTSLTVPDSVTLTAIESNGNPITVQWSYAWSRHTTKSSAVASGVTGTSSATVKLFRTIEGGSETLVATEVVAGEYDHVSDTTTLHELEQSQSGSWTYTDTVGGALTRIWRVEVSARSIVTMTGPGTEGVLTEAANFGAHASE